MAVNSGLLTTLLNTLVEAISGGFSKVYPDAMHLLAILATLEITIAALWWALTDDNALAALLRKCIHTGFFVYVVTEYPTIIKFVIDGFTSTGLKAGGGAPMALIRDPSAIIDYGLQITNPIFVNIQNINAMDVAFNLPHLILAGFAGILILLAFFAIGIQVLVTYVEFYIMAVLGLILIPFGVFKHTSFLAEKTFGSIITFGIRLMVLAFVLAVTSPILSQLTVPADPKITDMMLILLAALTIMVLAWHAPSIASGLISGAPSLTAGTAMGMGAAAVGGIAGAGLAGSAAAKEISNVGVKATRAAAMTTGALSGAVETGGLAGVGKLAVDTVGTVLSDATSGIKDSYEAGRMRGQGIATPSPPTPGGPTGGNSGEGSAMPNWAQKIQNVRSMVPPEAQPAAGIHVPVKHE